MQGLLNRNDLNLNSLHLNLHDLKMQSFNKNFAKFVMNKNNWQDIKQIVVLTDKILIRKIKNELFIIKILIKIAILSSKLK